MIPSLSQSLVVGHTSPSTKKLREIHGFNPDSNPPWVSCQAKDIRYSHFISILGQQKLPVSARIFQLQATHEKGKSSGSELLSFQGDRNSRWKGNINQFLPLIVGFSCNMLLEFWEIAATYFVLYPPSWRLKN